MNRTTLTAAAAALILTTLAGTLMGVLAGDARVGLILGLIAGAMLALTALAAQALPTDDTTL